MEDLMKTFDAFNYRISRRKCRNCGKYNRYRYRVHYTNVDMGAMIEALMDTTDIAMEIFTARYEELCDDKKGRKAKQGAKASDHQV